MNWNNMWNTLFNTTELFGINMGFWVLLTDNYNYSNIDECSILEYEAFKCY